MPKFRKRNDDDEEAEVGRVVKTCRTRRAEEQKEVQRKYKPHWTEKISLAEWLSKKEAKESPEEKKEELPMNQEVTKKLEALYCPACLGERTKIHDKESLVCGDCNQIFINEAAASLAKGKLITIQDWIVDRLTAQLAILEPKLVSVKAEIKKIEEDVLNEASAMLDETIGTAQVDPAVRRRAFGLKKDELWLAKGGNVKYACMKETTRKVALLKEALNTTLNTKPAETSASPTKTSTTALQAISVAAENPVAESALEPVLTAP